MSVAVEKLEGVESVEVSLNQGKARIRLRPGNSLSLEKLRRTVRNNGFTPREAQARVKGKLVSGKGQPALEVTGSGETYILKPSPKVHASDLKEKMGQTLVLEGTIPAAQEDGSEPILVVESIQRK